MSDFRMQAVNLAAIDRVNNGFTPLYTEMSAADMAAATPVAEQSAPDPYTTGLVEGQEIAAAAFSAERDALTRLIAAAEALQPEASDELAVLIGESVAMLVAQIVGDVEIDRNILESRAHQAAAIISECDAARTMWLHPDDAELLHDAVLPLEIRGDPKAERGSIRIDCSAGWIEHGTALYLERLRLELGLAGGAL